MKKQLKKVTAKKGHTPKHVHVFGVCPPFFRLNLIQFSEFAQSLHLLEVLLQPLAEQE